MLLGRITDMVPKGVTAPAPPPGTVMGFFHATKEFATHAAPLHEQATTGIDISSSQRFAERLRAAGLKDMMALNKEEARAKIQEIAKDDPDVQKMAAWHKAVMDLGLELKDADGNVLPTGAIMVQPFPPTLPGLVGAALDKMRASIKQEMAKAGLEVSDLMLVAQAPGAQLV